MQHQQAHRRHGHHHARLHITTVLTAVPHVWADKAVAKSLLGTVWPKHYGTLVGKTIMEIRFEDFEDAPLPVLVFTDGTCASVMCDPEGNGPGFLDIY